MIYFIGNREADIVKIGYSRDEDTIERRIKQIQTYCPFHVEVIGIIEGTFEQERLLHSKYEPFKTNFKNKRNEWFVLSMIEDPRFENLKRMVENLLLAFNKKTKSSSPFFYSNISIFIEYSKLMIQREKYFSRHFKTNYEEYRSIVRKINGFARELITTLKDFDLGSISFNFACLAIFDITKRFFSFYEKIQEMDLNFSVLEDQSDFVDHHETIEKAKKSVGLEFEKMPISTEIGIN